MSIKGSGHNDLIDKIEMPEELQKKILNNQVENSRIKVFYPKKVAFAAMFLAVFALGGIGVKAGLDTIHDRINSMDKKEKAQYESFREDNDSRPFDEEIGDVAVIYSRDLSRAEAIMEEKLTEEYKNGKFPEKTIRFVDNEAEIGSDELAIVRDVNKVVLPEKELSEAQMLQYVDFKNKYFTLANDYYAQNNDEDVDEEETFFGEITDEALRTEIKDKAVAAYNKAFNLNIGANDGWQLKDIFEEVDNEYSVVLFNDAMEKESYGSGRLIISYDTKADKLVSASKEYKVSDTKEYTEAEIMKEAKAAKKDVLAYVEKYFNAKKLVKCEYAGVNRYAEGLEYNTESSVSDMVQYTLEYKNNKFVVDYNPNIKEVLGVNKINE